VIMAELRDDFMKTVHPRNVKSILNKAFSGRRPRKFSLKTVRKVVDLVLKQPKMLKPILNWIQETYQGSSTKVVDVEGVTHILGAITGSIKFFLRKSESFSYKPGAIDRLQALLKKLPISASLQEHAMRLLDSENALIRWRALWALGSLASCLGSCPPTLATAVVNCLSDSDLSCRKAAALTLMQLMEVPELFTTCRKELPRILDGLSSLTYAHPSNKKLGEIFHHALTAFEDDLEYSTLAVLQSFVEVFDRCYQHREWGKCREVLSRMGKHIGYCRSEGGLVTPLVLEMKRFVKQNWTKDSAVYFSEQMCQVCLVCSLTPLDGTQPHRVSKWFLLSLTKAYLEN